MARVTQVKAAQQRFEMVPDLDDNGEQKVIPVLRRDGSPKTTKKGKEIVRRLSKADKTKPLPNRKCEKCGKEIEVGQPYKWVQPKSGPYGGRKRYRCPACPSWRPSETTSSSALAEIYGAQEAAEDALNAWGGEDLEEIRSILQEAAEGVRAGGECWRESAQNIEDGFGHETSTSQELADKADQIEASADDLENAADDFEEFDEEAARTEHENDVLTEYVMELEFEGSISTLEEALAQVDDFDQEEYDRRMEEAIEGDRQEWADDIRSRASDAINDVDIP